MCGTSQRRGYMLVEIMVTTSVCLLIATLCATLVQQVLRAHRGGLDLQQRLTVLANLSQQFRGDVHAARSQSLVVGDDGSPTLQLDLGERRTASYSLADGTLRRIERRQDAVRRREEFRPAGWSIAKLELQPGEPQLVAVVLQLSPASDAHNLAVRPRELRIEAVLGSAAAFAPTDEAQP